MELQSILTLEPARHASNSSVWFSFRRTFLSDCQRRRERDFELASWIYYCSWTLRSNTHTLGLRASISLSVNFPRKLCSLLLHRSLVQLSLIQPEGGERFLKAPHANNNKDILLQHSVVITTAHLILCFRLISYELHSHPLGVNLLFWQGRPFAVRHHNDIVNVQSETLEQSHHLSKTRDFINRIVK